MPAKTLNKHNIGFTYSRRVRITYMKVNPAREVYFALTMLWFIHAILIHTIHTRFIQFQQYEINELYFLLKPNRAKARKEKRFFTRKIIILEKRNFAFKRNILRFSYFNFFYFLKCEKRKLWYFAFLIL